MRDLLLAALLCLAMLAVPTLVHAQAEDGDGADVTGTLQTDYSDLSGLLGMPVIAADGDEVGLLQDVVLEEGEPKLAVIKTDGLLGLAQKEVTVDWADVKPTAAAVKLQKTTRPQILKAPSPAEDADRLTTAMEQD